MLLKRKIKKDISFFFSNFCLEKCRGGLSMDETGGISNESKN